MFDLEGKIREWRQQMLASGIKDTAVLDELETHLREDISAQASAGATAQEAFESAARRMGQPAALQSEFSKAGAAWVIFAQKIKQAFLSFIGIRAPVPVLDAWTAGAQRVLVLGSREARGFHHDFVGTEHLLLGVLGSEAENARGFMRRLGLDQCVVRSEIEKIVAAWPVQGAGRLPHYTPRAKMALVLATKEARAHNHTSVRAEHIFLGLLREGGGVAALVLKNLGVNLETARQEILSNQAGSDPASDAK